MKKTLLVIGILVGLFAALSACGRDTACYWDGLELYVAADSVTPTTLQLTAINNSNRYLGHGLRFRIEQYVNGTWRMPPIANNVMWHLPLIIIGPESSREEDISWHHMHGPLPPGKYRIVRNFTLEDFSDPTPPWQQYRPDRYLYAVFTIPE